MNRIIIFYTNTVIDGRHKNTSAHSIQTVHVPGKSDLVANNFLRDFEVQSNNWKKPPTYPPSLFVRTFSTPIFKSEFNKPSRHISERNSKKDENC